MRRHAVLLSCSFVLLFAGTATAQEGQPPKTPPPRKGGVQKAGFDLKQFETGLLDKAQMAKMEAISRTRLSMIEKLEKLLRDRPLYRNKAEIYFRLGEAYWQEPKHRYLVARQKFDAESDAFEAGSLAVKPTEPSEDYSTALEYYRKVIQQFPDYTRIDEVMFYLGRGALAQGKENKNRALVKEGVTYFQKLVQNYPRSRYIAQAHLALAEHFFETDSLYYAKTNYEKIINNHPSSPMFNYALYKLGWVYFNLREFRKTVTTFQKVVENIGSKKGQISFRDQALNDLVKTWAEMDDSWREALEYFNDVVKEEKDVYRRMEVLAGLYVGFDKDKEAMELYNHFIDKFPTSQKNPEWFEARLDVRKKINDFGETEKEIRRILAFFAPEGRWYVANKTNTEEFEQAHRLCEVNLLWLSNHWHIEAEKAAKYNKKDLAADMYKRAAADYKVFLARFPESKQIYTIRFYYAEILYDQINDYENALTQYQKVIEFDGKGKYIEDAALGVIYASYELMVKEGIREGSGKAGAAIVVKRLSKTDVAKAEAIERKIKRTDLHRLEKAYVDAADQYVNLLLNLRKNPDFVRKNPNRGKRIPEIMFLAADTFYRHGQFKQAVDRLKNIFRYDPKHKFAAVAAVTMVKAYSRLRRWSRVEEWARKLISQKNFKFKNRNELEGYIAVAIHEHSMDLSRARKHNEAIKESMRLVKEFRRKRKALAAKALMNVGVLYERARRIKDAVKTYERVIKEFKGESVASEAQYTIGLIYESQTRFKDAAAAFLKMSKFKKHPKAPDAIVNSGLIREAMRDYPGAIKAFQQYLKLFKSNDDAPDVFFKIGLLYERIGSTKSQARAVKHYAQFAKKYPDRYVMKVEAYSRAGDLLRQLDVVATNSKRNLNKKTGKPKRTILKNRRKASALFENALAEYPKAVQQILTLKGSDKTAKAVTARRYRAQAAYWLADYIFHDFDSAKIPGTLRPKILKEGLLRKAELHQTAEQAFDRVLPMKDAGWIACAAFRNGLLYYNFAKELFEVPIPFGLTPEQEDEYRAVLEEIGAPVQEKSLILLDAALKAAHSKGVYNRCAKQAGVFASKVSPEDYPITGDDQVMPRHTKDTLLSANFIRTLKRGPVVVDMLKRTNKDPAKEDK